MALEKCLGCDYEHMHELNQYEALSKQLAEFFQGEKGRHIFYGNFPLVKSGAKECMIDSVLVTDKAVIGIEFKDHGGRIKMTSQSWQHVNAYGNPECDSKGDAIVVKGGAHPTPFHQALTNYRELKNNVARYEGTVGMEQESGKSSKMHVYYFIVFNKQVTLIDDTGAILSDENLWLTVTDNTGFKQHLAKVLYSLMDKDDVWDDKMIQGFMDYIGAQKGTYLSDKDIHEKKGKILQEYFKNRLYRECYEESLGMGNYEEICLLRGKAAYYCGNVSATIKNLLVAKEAGNAEACYWLGMIYQKGFKHITVDEDEAKKCYQMAIERGKSGELNEYVEKAKVEYEKLGAKLYPSLLKDNAIVVSASCSLSILLIVITCVLQTFGLEWAKYIQYVAYAFALLSLAVPFVSEKLLHSIASEVKVAIPNLFDYSLELKRSGSKGRIGRLLLNVFAAFIPLGLIYAILEIVLQIGLPGFMEFSFFSTTAFLVEVKHYYVAYAIVVMLYWLVRHYRNETAGYAIDSTSVALFKYFWNFGKFWFWRCFNALLFMFIFVAIHDWVTSDSSEDDEVEQTEVVEPVKDTTAPADVKKGKKDKSDGSKTTKPASNTGTNKPKTDVGENASGKSKVSEGLQAVKVTFDNPILFNYKSYDLPQQNKQTVLELVKVLKDNPGCELQVVGYIDAEEQQAGLYRLAKMRAEQIVYVMRNAGVTNTLEVKVGNDKLQRTVEMYLYASVDMIDKANGR